jgi:membrane protein
VVDDVASYVDRQGAPSATVEAVRASVRTAVSARTGSSIGVVLVGMLVALYGASGWLSAAGKGLEAVLEDDGADQPGFVRRKAIAIAATLALIAVTLLSVVLVFLGGGVAEDLLGTIGIGGLAGAWQWFRWPLAFGATVVSYGIIYATAPAMPRRFHLISSGAAVGVGLWLVISFGFFQYVDRIGSYNATYGVFAGFVVLLVWLWLTNLTVLVGAEVDRELALRGE